MHELKFTIKLAKNLHKIFFILMIIQSHHSLCQNDSSYIKANIKPLNIKNSIILSGVISNYNKTPFWLRSKSYGSVPLKSPSLSLENIFSFSYILNKTKLKQKWAINNVIHSQINITDKSKLILPEIYTQIKKNNVYIYIGKKREVIGYGDSTLTSGFFNWSGNSMPLPKIQIGSQSFIPLKFTKGLVSLNFLFAHGLFPNSDSIQKSYLHQKALYGRIGKKNWKVLFYGGLIHSAQWGGESNYLPLATTINGKLPSTFKDYLSVILIKSPDDKRTDINNFDKANQIGNHLGSIDLGATISTKYTNIQTYIQRPYEDKSGIVLKNLPDGLYGLSFAINGKSNKMSIKKLTIEYLYTKSQSGSTYWISKKYGGLDDYFNHGQYLRGWTVDNYVIGTPFISRRQDVKTNLLINEKESQKAIVNNRLKLYHIGFLINILGRHDLTGYISYSINYGRYISPSRPKEPDFFSPKKKQLSAYINFSYKPENINNTKLSLEYAIDQGELLENNNGIRLKLQKDF